MNYDIFDECECQVTIQNDEMLLPAKIDHFELKGEIGQGGVGIVFKAINENFGHPVALKFLRPTLREDRIARQRFKIEARTAASIDHENIVSVNYFGQFSGLPFIAMEYVPGKSLADLKAPLSTKNALDYLEQATKGLAAAAEAGHIHRDIKPSNLLLRPDGLLKITDFGLARSIDKSNGLTAGNTIIGTPNFISPEQACAEEVDFKSDMYSLGATFYYLLSGKLPFYSETVTELLYSHVYHDPKPLHQLRKRLPEKLYRVIERLMEKDPENRYDNYAELLADIKSISLKERNKRPSKKYRRTVATVAVTPEVITPKLVTMLFGTGCLLILMSSALFLING